MTDQELKDLVASFAIDRKELAAMQKETDRRMQETDRRMQETDRQIKAVNKQIGGISNSNGDFAEEFFYNSLKETMSFAGVHYEYISDKFAREKKMPDKTEVRAQFDIVLHNGDSIALIEAKYKADVEDIKEMLEKKIPNFRFLYPEYAKYKLYLGIGSLILKDRVVQEAKKLGIGLMKQRGDAVEYKTDWVRAY
ncbi:hypothetical protein R83H12_02491 [Fibrobacteria bacterium R8-3-H12]